MDAHTARRLTVAAVAATAVALAGCTQDRESAAVARGGTPATTVLRFATIDSVEPGGEIEFINAVEDVSGGRLILDVVTEYGEAAPEAEADLVRAVAGGSLDLGIAATRGYARAGITGLQAIEAPLLLDTHAAVMELIEGPVGQDVLADLEDDGLHGLALLYGGLRRPAAGQAPLLDPEDWNGTRFRAYNSPVQQATIEALGGTAVNVSYDWEELMNAGSLDAVDLAIDRDLVDRAPILRFVTANVALWPKVETIVINQKRWDALTDDQRSWLETAAQRAVGANVALDREEDEAVGMLCDAGVRLVLADNSQRDRLEEAVSSVHASLSADPAESPLLTALEQIASRHEGPDAPRVPVACQDPDPPSSEASPAVSVPDSQDRIPDGTYRMSVSEDELLEAGIGNGPGWSGTWTMTIEEGVYALTCAPVDRPGKDCGNFSGSANFVLEGGPVLPHEVGVQLAFDLDPESDLTCAGCAESDGYVVSWTLEGDQLTLSHAGIGNEAWQWTFKPWTKID